jgi:hypothetical protein
MYDIYPQDIVKSGMSEAWRKAPIAMEICGTFLSWQEVHKYDEEDVMACVHVQCKEFSCTGGVEASGG